MSSSATSAPALDAGAAPPLSAPSSLVQYVGFVPALVLFGLFFAAPLGLIVAYSFWQTVDYNVVHHWTVDNYRYFFSVSTYVSTMWATIWVAILATAITIGIAFPFTYWLVRYVRPSVQRLLARARDSPVLDELPAPRLLVAEHPRRRRRDQPLPPVDAASPASRCRSSSTTGRR